MTDNVNFEYYKILLVGASGSGKTYTAKTLDPANTGVINVENKPMPFKASFVNHFRSSKYQECYNKLIEYAKNPAIKTIFLDSFSAYMDSVLKEARATKKGYEIWNMYNDEIAKFADLIKRIPKDIFVTSHYETLDVEGIPEKRVKSKGKEYEGMVEKDYTIVLYAGSKQQPGKRPEYYLNLYQERTSAKCPPDIFGTDILSIENDGGMIVRKLDEFRA